MVIYKKKRAYIVHIQCLLRVDGGIGAGVFLTSFFCVVPESPYSSYAASESERSVNNHCYLYYSHALLRIHVIGGQRPVRIAPLSLAPHHSSPATRDFHPG